tara:strand:- start:3018 stop:5759 length:2742 start_codon:yes stop_codon:yes gene_type:complete
MSALTAQKNMQAQNNELNDAMTRLSSGLRINSAADDAAGSAIASKMEAQVRSLDVAVRNSYDAISMTQTAEGALGEMENILQRVRELSVQAANSTLSSNDRSQIQAEVDSLIAEVDSIASKTHFNNVKLLDGSNSDVTFQIGIGESDSLAVKLEKSDSTSLGLNEAQGVTKLTSERIAKVDYTDPDTTANILASDVKINGFDALAAAFASDLTAATTNTAKAIADAINANSGVHGAEANAFNSFTSDAVGTFNQLGSFTINGDTVETASSYAGLVSNINESVSGVRAALNSNNTITLSNTTGDDIIIGSSATNAQSVGFGPLVTYTGFVSLENIDGSEVTIEAGSVENGYTGGAGTIADVNSLGFNEFSVAGKLETATVSGTALSANEFKINDVLIDESLSGSAYHVASTINAKTSEHGVTADAANKVNLDLDFEARPTSATAFSVNGTTVDLRAANNSADFVTAFNNLSIGDLRASSNSDGTVDINSASGLNIVVSNTDNDFVIGAKDLHGGAINTGLGNGTIDYDGIFDGSSAVGAAVPYSAAIPGGLDLTGGALYNQVINSTVQVTQHAAQDYSAVTWTITGKDADGNTITEALQGIAGTTGTEQDQKRGTQIFHTIDKIVTNAAMTYGYSIGTYSTVATEFDIDSLVTSATIASAGTLTLNGALATSDLNNSVVTFANTTDHSAAAITFTVTGEDAFGATITEAISYGSDNIQDTTVTVHGTQAFHKVTTIHASAGSTSAMQIGTMQVGDVVEARGNLTLTNSNTTPIKVESVARDSNALNLAAGATGVIMAKMGIQAQGGAFEVKGAGIDVSTLNGANTSLAAIDKAIDKISLFRSSFGAVENRIDASINNLTTLKINTQAAQSRIVDADFAAETSRMTKSQILSQAATSMLAQANASKQNLLALLQG